MSNPVVVQAPMSLTGATLRMQNWLGALPLLARIPAWILIGAPLLVAWWTLIVCWYLVFGLFLIPYRLVRRGQRQRKRDAQLFEAARKG